jgi:hypothetical protein
MVSDDYIYVYYSIIDFVLFLFLQYYILFIIWYFIMANISG